MRKSKGFQCKHFYVAHDKCAMKVGTDSLILGSWVNINDVLPYEGRVLDIGTGSGLLALMLAQRTNATVKIDAIDICEEAAHQAQENFARSRWANRMTVLTTDVVQYEPDKSYEFIVCNPPYFDAIHSPSQGFTQLTTQRNIARLNECLSADTLMRRISALLSEDGHFACVYPYSMMKSVIDVASKYSLYLARIVKVKSTPNKEFYLCALQFSFSKVIVEESEVTIRNSDNSYTDAYKALCQDFYLNF